MPNIVVWKKNGIEQEVRGEYFIRQPHPASAADINYAAERACEVEAKKKVDAWNDSPDSTGTYEFYDVKLIRIDGQSSDTKTNPWTLVQHWEGKGVGVCRLLYIIK